MAESSAIEWTDSTWNPVTGCTRVSPGCAHCYIETTIPFRTKRRRFERVGNEETTGVILHPERLDPKKVPKGPRIFVNSLSDLFHEELEPRFVAEVFAVMSVLSDRTFQVLTKRPEQARAMLAWPKFWLYVNAKRLDLGYPVLPGGMSDTWPLGRETLPNVWLGVSIENSRYTYRADVLREIPAAVRFISAEPLLGSLYPPVTFTRSTNAGELDYATGKVVVPETVEWERRAPLDLTGIDWLIVGGESGGRQARPMHPEWARELRLVAQSHKVAFFFKQWGSWSPIRPKHVKPHGGSRARSDALLRVVASAHPDGTVVTTSVYYHGAAPKSGGRLLDGREWNEMPCQPALTTS